MDCSLGYLLFMTHCCLERGGSFTHTHTHPITESSLWSFLQGFVLAVAMTRELLDDFKRFLRDKEVNSQKFTKLTSKG